jgi:hypothetical protein
MHLVAIYPRLLKSCLKSQVGFGLNKFVFWFVKQITEIEKQEIALG